MERPISFEGPPLRAIDRLLACLVKRLGGKVEISDIDLDSVAGIVIYEKSYDQKIIIEAN